MKAAIHLILILFCISCTTESFGQQPVFSQFYSAGMYYNPALTGTEKDIMTGLNYRTQWNSLGLPFTTFQLSYIHPLTEPDRRLKHTGGIGGSLLSDITGENNEFRQTGVFLAGAYNIHLNRYGNSMISLGAQVGIMQKRIDPAAFQWNSQYNPMLGFDSSIPPTGFSETDQVWYPLINAGVLWTYHLKERYSRKQISFYQGFAVAGINTPNTTLFDQSRDDQPIIYRAHGGAEMFLTQKLSMSLNYLIQKESEFFQFNAGTYFSYHLDRTRGKDPAILIAGAWYRFDDSAILSLGIEYNHVRLVGSYDRNVHALSRYYGAAAAFEFSLQWRLIRNSGLRRYGTPMI